MFLWNMLGAMVLLPSLAYFLLPPRLFPAGGVAPAAVAKKPLPVPHNMKLANGRRMG